MKPAHRVAKRAPPRRVEWVVLLGERLCLDFVNSANWQDGVVADETLVTAIDVVDWAERARVLSPDTARRWRTRFGRDPAAAGMLLEDVYACRRELRSIFQAALRGRQPTEASRDTVNAWLRGGAPARLVTTGSRFESEPLDGPLGPWLLGRVATSALELLVSEDRAALGSCPGRRCGWFYLDRTRGRTRRWCRMETCGNRAKARRHYERERDGEDLAVSGRR